MLLRFWFYLRYKIISMFYLTFTLLSFNLLHFISTPSNCSPTCIWFYLRYKIRKIIQSSVLSFSNVLKVANFFLPYLCSVFLVLLGRKLMSGYSPPIMQSSFACFFSGWGYNILRDFGEHCKSVPLDHTGSYISISINIYN